MQRFIRSADETAVRTSAIANVGVGAVGEETLEDVVLPVDVVDGDATSSYAYRADKVKYPRRKGRRVLGDGCSYVYVL